MMDENDGPTKAAELLAFLGENTHGIVLITRDGPVWAVDAAGSGAITKPQMFQLLRYYMDQSIKEEGKA